MDLQRHISMCTRHHAKWKRMASFARTKEQRGRYLEKALFWLEMQAELVSLWDMEQKQGDRDKLAEAKSKILTKLTGYGREMTSELDF